MKIMTDTMRYEHINVITTDLIMEALLILRDKDVNNVEIIGGSYVSSYIAFNIDTIKENITKWLEEDLKLVIEVSNVNVYGHKRYYGMIYKNQEAYEKRFENFDINKEIKPNGIEIKAKNKINGREILFHNEEQLLFAIFKYILENKEIFNIS
jgi:hypothetical protein